MMHEPRYAYRQSIKSDVSDELVNTYLVRPIAGVLVRLLYITPVTPNQVTIAAILAGIISATVYLGGTAAMTATAGLLLTVKDLLDSADGQLARAKKMYSRAGRFLDSIGDLVVNLLVFTAITCVLFLRSGDATVIPLGFIAFLGTTLRVSYHVFYHTSYLHLQSSYAINRVREDIKEEDYAVDPTTFRLHRVFVFLYGWQDRMMDALDRWCIGGSIQEGDFARSWYSEIVGLRLAGFLGLGTELFLVMLFSVTYRLEEYLYANALGMNGVWLVSVLYRKYWLAPRLRRDQPS